MTAISAMQKWLALEHEAVWLYPLVGARFGELTRLSRRTRDAHLVTRDKLLERLHDAGAEPVATALSYEVGPLSTAAEAQKAARSVETRIAAACLGLVGEVEGDARDFATSSLRRAALTDLDWGGTPTAFPGLP
jgi:hypothetical protein